MVYKTHLEKRQATAAMDRVVLLATVACGASSWNTQNSQKRLVFSENSERDNS